MAADHMPHPQPLDPRLPPVEIDEAGALMESGEYQKALELYEKDYALKAKPRFQIMGRLGLLYLLTGRLDMAKKILDEATELKMPRMETSYVWAGTVRWLLNDPVAACKVWVEGLNCQYRDPAGGLEVPLLLYFAGLSYPEAYNSDEAKGLIKERLASRRAIHWPGPLGKFVLGHLSQLELNEIASKTAYEPTRMRRLAAVEFYSGVFALQEKQRSSFFERMKRCVAIPESKFIHEGLLARHELSSREK